MWFWCWDFMITFSCFPYINSNYFLTRIIFWLNSLCCSICCVSQMPQEAPRCHLEECWRQDEEAVPPGQAPAESCGSWPVWGAAGFYVVGTPDLFWGAKIRHCFGLTCEDSKLKPSPGCNQRNQAHLKLFKHIQFPPGETRLPWLTAYPRQACLGAAFHSSYSLCSCLQSLCPSLVVSPSDALKQLLGSDSAVIFLSYCPQRTTKEEAISPALVGRKRTRLTLFLLAQNAFLVSCVLRFTPVCLHILSTLTAVDSCDPVTLALHLLALSLVVFNPCSTQ